MTDDPKAQGARVFDMPHARVTLTPVGPGIEIEVWPKRGQSAYAVVDPGVAIMIARQLVELAATQIAAVQIATSELDAAEAAAAEAGDPVDGGGDIETGEPGSDGDPAPEARTGTVIDLASRRRRDPGAAG